MKENHHDRHPQIRLARPCRPWLARRAPPFLLRRLSRSGAGWAGARSGSGTTTGSPPSSGFPPHPHRDMEIITYVRTGAITHQDSMGNKGRTAAGDVQVMSAGTGVQHAEYNLEDEETTLFQIWVQTDRPGAQPSWGAAKFPKADRSGQLRHPGERLRRGCRGAPDQCGRAGDGRDPGGGRDGRADARSVAPCLSGRDSAARSRSTASAPSPATASRSPARTKVTIKALEEAEIVLVDAR